MMKKRNRTKFPVVNINFRYKDLKKINILI